MIHVSCHALIKIMGTRELIYEPNFKCSIWNANEHWARRRACDGEPERLDQMVAMESMRDKLGFDGAEPMTSAHHYDITCPKCAVMYDQAIQFRESNTLLSRSG